MEHRLKTWPEFFMAVRSGAKTFELRRDDRAYAVGDVLYLEEWEPSTATYTGNTEKRVVSYVARDLPDEFGLRPGFVILGFSEWD